VQLLDPRRQSLEFILLPCPACLGHALKSSCQAAVPLLNSLLRPFPAALDLLGPRGITVFNGALLLPEPLHLSLASGKFTLLLHAVLVELGLPLIAVRPVDVGRSAAMDAAAFGFGHVRGPGLSL
jgi:hypothetical protein